MEIVRERRYGVVDFGAFPLGCFFEHNGEVYLKISPLARECCEYNAYNCERDDLLKFERGVKVIPLNAKVVIE